MKNLPPNLAERLWQERERGFVGRAAEVELFERLLREPTHPLLFLGGQLGVGKTALLHELRCVAGRAGSAVALLDADQLLDQVDSARRSVSEQLARSGSQPGARSRSVLLIDAFERLGDRPERLLRELLAVLPGDAQVVVTSRAAPPTALALDAGWGRLLLQRSLTPLSDAESLELLQRRGAPPGAQRAILEFAGGYPLALALAADATLRAGTDAFTIECLQGAQQGLARLLGGDDHSPSQQLALDVCCIARTTTAELLDCVRQQTSAAADTHDAFGWLGRQSFVEFTPGGLQPHALVRAALSSRLRRERPKRFRATFQIIREYCLGELAAGQNPDVDLANLLFLDRNAPVVRTWSRPVDEQPARQLEPIARSDRVGVVDLVRELEGVEASQVVAAYLDSDRETFEVVRGERVESLLHVSRFSSDSGPSRLPRIDPASAAVLRFVAANPLRDDEEGVFFRWFCDRDGYQAPTPNVLAVTGRQTQILLGTRALAYSLCVFRSVPDWLPLWKSIGMPWNLIERFHLDEREYSLVAFDWRRRPLRELLANAWRQPGEIEGQDKEATSFDELRVMVTERVARLARETKLTRREVEVLERLCLGLSLDDIGRQLSIRPRTVKFHQENLLRKTGVSSRTELFRKLL